MGRNVVTSLTSQALTEEYKHSGLSKQTFFTKIKDSFGHRLNNDYCYCNVIENGIVFEIFSYSNDPTIGVKF